eukprot:3018888-Pyramimonas_sp.AAC.1
MNTHHTHTHTHHLRFPLCTPCSSPAALRVLASCDFPPASLTSSLTRHRNPNRARTLLAAYEACAYLRGQAGVSTVHGR